MKLIDRYEFTNGKAFETYYLSPADTQRFEKPECDVIGLRRVADNLPDTMAIMRPDEALIQARMLIDAVNKVTEGYTVSGPKIEELNFGGIPIVTDPTVPKDEIRLRQSGKTEAVFRITDKESML